MRISTDERQMSRICRDCLFWEIFRSHLAGGFIAIYISFTAINILCPGEGVREITAYLTFRITLLTCMQHVIDTLGGA